MRFAKLWESPLHCRHFLTPETAGIIGIVKVGLSGLHHTTGTAGPCRIGARQGTPPPGWRSLRIIAGSEANWREWYPGCLPRSSNRHPARYDRSCLLTAIPRLFRRRNRSVNTNGARIISENFRETLEETCLVITHLKAVSGRRESTFRGQR